jgi:hypothetical protein
MNLADRVRREARATLVHRGYRVPCWMDYMRVILASYPWWARPFVRRRCEVAATAISNIPRRVRPAVAREYAECHGGPQYGHYLADLHCAVYRCSKCGRRLVRWFEDTLAADVRFGPGTPDGLILAMLPLGRPYRYDAKDDVWRAVPLMDASGERAS